MVTLEETTTAWLISRAWWPRVVGGRWLACGSIQGGDKMTPKTIQAEPLATDDLSPYRGSWVAIRNGRVIASALDPVELRDRDDAREDDELMLVPSQFASTLVL
jgi:hypothetical protein